MRNRLLEQLFEFLREWMIAQIAAQDKDLDQLIVSQIRGQPWPPSAMDSPCPQCHRHRQGALGLR
jgi:hypothetical protein